MNSLIEYLYRFLNKYKKKINKLGFKMYKSRDNVNRVSNELDKGIDLKINYYRPKKH